MKLKKFLLPGLALILTFSSTLAGCRHDPSEPPSSPLQPTVNLAAIPTPPVSLKGAGGTFPALLYTKWFDQFNQLYKVQINYDAVGSGAGISAITAGTVDFGASDGLMTDSQIAAAATVGGPILHIPMTIGAIAVIYNIPGIKSGDLKLTGAVLGDIYLKTITKWNDPAIGALNPALSLPDANIAVVHRSDSSGTTNIYTNYLCKVSPQWASHVGSANSVNWPGDIGGSGNPGVAGQVLQVTNSIGYIELAYALQNNLAFATLENSSGAFVSPSLASTTAAATGVALPDDMKVMLTDSSNKDAYPIVGFTWILVYQNQKDAGKGAELVDFLWWAVHDGMSYASDLTYAPLSADATRKAESLIKSITYQSLPLLKAGN